MQRHDILYYRKYSNRHQSFHGLSFVEFLGCLAAVSGGVALGSMYLGVDVKTMAIGILEKAELIEPGQFGSGDENAPNDSKSDVKSSTKETLANETRPAEVESEKTIEITKPEEFDGTATEHTPGNRNDSDATVEVGDPDVKYAVKQRASLTRQYWTKMDKINHQESKNRLAKSAKNRSWQLFDYLTHRKNGHQQAAEAIKALSQHGVDAKVLDYSDKVLQWHLFGVKLNSRAVQLLTDAPSSQLTGPFAQDWQSAATQHRMEEKLLLKRRQAVARYIQHTF